MAFDTTSTSNKQLAIRLVPLAYLAALVGSFFAAHSAGTDELFGAISLPWSLALGGPMLFILAGALNTLALSVITAKVATR